MVMEFICGPECTELEAEITWAIRAAVAEEREACAKLAEQTNDCCECGDVICCKGTHCRTAAAIRARTA